MTNRCVTIDGALVHVSDKFDTTEGSADMEAMREVLAAARRKYFAETPDPVSVANAEQSRRLQAMGNRNDRADITSGNGYSRHDGDDS